MLGLCPSVWQVRVLGVMGPSHLTSGNSCTTAKERREWQTSKVHLLCLLVASGTHTHMSAEEQPSCILETSGGVLAFSTFLCSAFGRKSVCINNSRCFLK